MKNDKQRRAVMGHDRRSYPEAHERRRHEQGDDAQADDQILPDDPAGDAAEADRERQMREIAGHERDIGGLARDVRPRGPPGAARRGVVDRTEGGRGGKEWGSRFDIRWFTLS